mgnify:CR=1 FL=1
MKILSSTRGASLVEYGMLLGLVATVSITAISRLGQQVDAGFSNTSDTLATSMDHILPPPGRGPLADQIPNCHEGTPGNDRIEDNSQETLYNCVYGYGGHDDLIWTVSRPANFYPGPGDDYTFTGAGLQVHHYESGNDTIEDRNGDDVLILPTGMLRSEVSFEAPDYGDVNGAEDFRISTSHGTVTTVDQFMTGGIQEILFDDGSITRDEFSALVLDGYATEGDDTLYATASRDILHPGAGNDTVYAGRGDDTIVHSSGDDIFYPGADNDKLEASIPLGSADAWIDTNHADLHIAFEGGSSIYVPGQFSSAPGVNARNSRFTSFKFTDREMTWDDMRLYAIAKMEETGKTRIFGSSVADVIRANGSSIMVQGNGGDDTIEWIAGNLSLSEKGGGFDTLDMSAVDPTTISTSTSGGKDGIMDLPDGTRIIFQKLVTSTEGSGNSPVERILFADGVVYEERQVRDLFGAP